MDNVHLDPGAISAEFNMASSAASHMQRTRIFLSLPFMIRYKNVTFRQVFGLDMQVSCLSISSRQWCAMSSGYTIFPALVTAAAHFD